MYDSTVQFPGFVFVTGIEPGLEQEAILIAEDLPGQAGRMIKVALYIVLYGEKNHTDVIPHIGQAAGSIAAAIQTVAGLPGVSLTGHLQKITGVDRQNACLSDLEWIKRVRQPGEYRIVGLDCYSDGIVPMFTLHLLGLVLVQPEFNAQPVDNPAGLLSLSALNAAACPNRLQAARRRYSGVVRRG